MKATEICKNVAAGVVVGVANVIPGVSGGTMAVVLHVFDQLVEALSLKNLKKHIGFLITLGFGAVIGILAFSNAITYLLEHFPVATNLTFIGLIVGSIPMIFRRAWTGKVSCGNVIPFLIGAAVMVALAFVNEGTLGNHTETVLTVTNFFYLLAVAAVSTVAMILPGISGSLVMMILGAYYTVIGAISDLNIPILIPVAIGCLIGLVFGSRLISKLIERFPSATYSAILGLVVGSLYSLLPRQFTFNAEGICAIVLLIAGAAVALLFSRSKEAA